MTATPKTIPEYLDQLRAALRGADPALVQDALYDAEEYLRAELAANPAVPEAELLASIASSYGAPEEVAEIYRDTEVQVTRALRTPPPAARRSLAGRFFGVATDARAWTGLFYMLLSLATGIVYFTVVVAGISVSAGMSVLVIGIPVLIVFVGVVRILSLVEGRIVEVMLGERMPRRPVHPGQARPWLQRIADMFTDPRTWSTMLYLALMLPLGIVYFTTAVTGIATGAGLAFGGLAAMLEGLGLPMNDVGVRWDGYEVLAPWAGPTLLVLGVLLVFAVLHLARGVAHLHGALAKHLLVKSDPA